MMTAVDWFDHCFVTSGLTRKVTAQETFLARTFSLRPL